MLMLRTVKYLALALAVAGAALVIDPRAFHVGAAVISLGTINALLVCFISLLVMVIAAYSQRNLLGQAGLTRYSASLLTAFAGLIVMVTAGTLAQFALGWTISGQATAFLVAHAASATARRASRYVRTWLLVSDLFVWLAVIAASMPSSPTLHIEAISFSGSATGAFLVAACIARTGLVPAHRWLAQTAEAPSPVSAFLHAGIINAAGITVVLWLPEMRPWLPILLLSACATVIVGLWTINNRADIKGKLASSTTTQMAFMSIEAAVGLPGLALLHLFGHGGYKSWCFLRAGGVITRGRLGRRPITRSWSVFALSVLVTMITLTAMLLLISAIAAMTALACAAYLALVHAWLAWLPVAHWMEPTLVAVALASLAIGALGTRVLPRSTVHRLTWFMMAPRWLRERPSETIPWPPAVDDIYATELMRLDELVDIAGSCAAPSWPLRTAVAINPMQSLTGMSFTEASATASTWGVTLYPSASHY
ncbi:MAG: proton-conducting transporter membrane subunit, partial [Acidobacteria bacterium]|nr:proton-conducting transporter membrane subunit [Acidobacteriota bacterium]